MPELRVKVIGKVLDKHDRKAKKQFLKTILQKIAKDYQNTMYQSVLFIASNSNIFNFLYYNGFYPCVEDKHSKADITIDINKGEVYEHD